ncbi:Potassium channel family and Potassium channel tetramerisation-type BTB domain and Potassium channel, voltage dependent, Kv family and Potassium channel, voltage dependent, Kv9 family and Ion transport domain and BTB/POZ fold domain and Voltage-dependent channel, four helix bundle domain-containing protein [Strongyloides ratti]|uniref:BTB domain-containing protein n=1 Tax=Strongyloides ratti TaxID=34506 RepID=A0A090MYK3_STRRB|nr:Potassium channel family and Potassium channel tetramerisation-type BTB domain and Potassium channel, voltage dependent, Kv family and Potassium channel, voltage dependent, Kv9 family and Ion transport domain and BTB/POZ fold domain and Voltage-dependent channel, four helix bundle domain-containing protein [Strongyloides ratti]CEF67334.1 Potassium channel family and Potassium channel tetramerisation-type BTB domain and Potassium channel, voltage dependent, Kv family and Potassium channel, volta
MALYVKENSSFQATPFESYLQQPKKTTTCSKDKVDNNTFDNSHDNIMKFEDKYIPNNLSLTMTRSRINCEVLDNDLHELKNRSNTDITNNKSETPSFTFCTGSNNQYNDSTSKKSHRVRKLGHISKQSQFLLLNIGGQQFRIKTNTIKYRCPVSLLGVFCDMTHEERLTQCDGYIEETDEYYFERCGRLFEPIFDFFTTGHFHKPTDICEERVLMEIDFWKIQKTYFAPCCMGSNEKFVEYEGIDEFDDDFNNPYSGRDKGWYNSFRKKLYRICEEPTSSRVAQIFGITSIGMVIISVSAMIVASMPEFQRHINGTNNSMAFNGEGDPILFLEIIEWICMIWFTVEYILRILVAPKKFKFIISPLNLIDIFTIVPFYLEVILSYGEHLATINDLSSMPNYAVSTIVDLKALALVLRAVRVMRVTRVFKLARYSSGLKSFGLTVRTSLPELSMLGLFLLTTVIFFSTLMYFAEKDEPNTKFKSIPAASWWCIITMTTVGYGDSLPTTAFGKFIASGASIGGVLVLAFPITMIVENFSKNYASETNDFQKVRIRRRMAKAYG